MAGSDGSHADIEWRFAESIFSATQGTAHVISIYLERLGRSVCRFAESQNREDTPVHGATYMSHALLTKYLSCKMNLADAAIFAIPFINMRFGDAAQLIDWTELFGIFIYIYHNASFF